MRIPSAALLLAVLAVPAARAADLSTLDCVSEKLDATVKAQIEADAVRNLSEVGKRPTNDPSVGKGLNEAAIVCAKEHKWSAEAGKAAGIYALAKTGLPVAQRVVGEHGFDAAALEGEFQSLPEEERNQPLSAATMQKLVIASVTDEAQQTRENAELLNRYFLFLSTLHYSAYAFSQG